MRLSLCSLFLVCVVCCSAWWVPKVKKEREHQQQKRDGIPFEDDEEYEKVLKTLRNILSREVPQSHNQATPSRNTENREPLPWNTNPKISTRTLRFEPNIKDVTRDPPRKRTLQKKDGAQEPPRRTLQKKYLNEWLVHMSGGEDLARSVVKELGYKFNGPVKGFEDMYAISHLRDHHSHKREARDITTHINSHAQVLWAEQQVSKLRVKRNGKPHVGNHENLKPTARVKKVMDLRFRQHMFKDPLWPHQWYLFDSRIRDLLPELDLKVIPVWESGITGKGVNVVVLDDGLEWKHDDIIKSYNPNISYDLNDDDVDPTPRYDEVRTNSHGTKCAGEIVMEPNNEKCGVGVAYGSSIGGIRMLDGDVSDRIEGEALGLNYQSVDIVSCSWGPNDDGYVVEGPGTFAKMALERGIREGRNGKGTLYVWASGNGGYATDNCNCDGYTSSIYTIGVNTASESGESPWYSEQCSSTITSTYSSGAYSDQKVATTDIENDCTIDFSGTSASAPLAAGIVALALEANPSLSWRDIQHIIVRASDWLPLSSDDDWQENGVGRHFNMKFGFGLLTAEPLVNLSRTWTTVPEKLVCEAEFHTASGPSIESGGMVKMETIPQCESGDRIKALEHVQVVMTIEHTQRGSLEISLNSPQGTRSTLLTPRPEDESEEGFDAWPFMSVHLWGENPNGTWVLTIKDTSEDGQSGTVISAKLILHGTANLLQQ